MIDCVPSLLDSTEYRSGSPQGEIALVGAVWTVCKGEKSVIAAADHSTVPGTKDEEDRIVTCSWALTPSAVAVSIACPAATPVTIPVPFAFVEMVAMLVLLMVQVASGHGIPRLSTAVNCCVPPITMFTAAGVICNEKGGVGTPLPW